MMMMMDAAAAADESNKVKEVDVAATCQCLLDCVVLLHFLTCTAACAIARPICGPIL